MDQGDVRDQPTCNKLTEGTVLRPIEGTNLSELTVSSELTMTTAIKPSELTVTTMANPSELTVPWELSATQPCSGVVAGDRLDWDGDVLMQDSASDLAPLGCLPCPPHVLLARAPSLLALRLQPPLGSGEGMHEGRVHCAHVWPRGVSVRRRLRPTMCACARLHVRVCVSMCVCSRARRWSMRAPTMSSGGVPMTACLLFAPAGRDRHIRTGRHTHAHTHTHMGRGRLQGLLRRLLFRLPADSHARACTYTHTHT